MKGLRETEAFNFKDTLIVYISELPTKIKCATL